jgi:GTP cyclohydrolase II
VEPAEEDHDPLVTFAGRELDVMTTLRPPKKKQPKTIVLTSHPGGHWPKPVPVVWGAEDPMVRGPLIGTVTNTPQRNVVGTHAGSYSVYRAVAVAAGALDPLRKPDLTNTSPTHAIGPFPQWFDPSKIVSLDPFGAIVSSAFRSYFEQGYDIRPTIAVTRARIHVPELAQAVLAGRVKVDGKILREGGAIDVVKAAIEPVWYLPGVAARFGCTEATLRRTLFEHTAGMFPELVTRGDLEVFLPPIGGATIYMIGDVASIADRSKPLAVRVHDECNGSDVFGSDICTCRPYLTHGIEECVRTAQDGGSGVIVYNRKEGRALGEVTKFLVYNARKRQDGGDRAEQYFARTECVAGVQDMRFQELMPDVLHWLGIAKIDRFVSMSNMKYDAVVRAGIEIVHRVPLPDDLIPPDARVEMDAKMAAGYFTEGAIPDGNELAKAKGRALEV